MISLARFLSGFAPNTYLSNNDMCRLITFHDSTQMNEGQRIIEKREKLPIT